MKTCIQAQWCDVSVSDELTVETPAVISHLSVPAKSHANSHLPLSHKAVVGV